MATAKLMNPDNINPNLNAFAIEDDFIKRTKPRGVKQSDPNQEYERLMKELSMASGVPLGNIEIDAVESDDDGPNIPSSLSEEFGEDSDSGVDVPQEMQRNGDFMDNMATRRQNRAIPDIAPPEIQLRKKRQPFNRTRPSPQQPASPLSTDPTPAPQLLQSQYRPVTNYQPNYSQPNYNQSQTNYPQPQPNYGSQTNYSQPQPNYGAGYGQPTGSAFAQAMQGYTGAGQAISVEREREEETKTILLEDIDELMNELEEEGVDLSRIPEVDQDSPIEDVKTVNKILRMKYDRRRYTNFGEEVILAAVHGLEYLILVV